MQIHYNLTFANRSGCGGTWPVMRTGPSLEDDSPLRAGDVQVADAPAGEACDGRLDEETEVPVVPDRMIGRYGARASVRCHGLRPRWVLIGRGGGDSSCGGSRPGGPGIVVQASCL